MQTEAATDDMPCQAGCPVCRSSNIDSLFEIPRVPVNCNMLWPTREAALESPQGSIRLGFCRNCSHLFNATFDPALIAYTQSYENSLHFSPRFKAYAHALANRLIERYDLYGRQIVEIGCGKGEFLAILCELGDNRGIGFDPSYVPDRGAETAQHRVTFVQDYYSEQYAHHDADLIVCQHVLEHIADPYDFMQMIRRSIPNGQRTPLYFEVPNALSMVREGAIWDIIYEHRSYFSSVSLTWLFHACGFVVERTTEDFGGQYLGIEARAAGEADRAQDQRPSDAEQVASRVAAFAGNYRDRIATWKRRLAELQEAGRRAVVWGGGAKGVMFLNTLGEAAPIAYIVDINPYKQGMYVAGTGQQIVAPEFLRKYQPDVVIVMNPIYTDEIRRQTAEMGLHPVFLAM